ncbi:MAG TPA: hypothetical protein PKK06_02950 [Phycisphaerae bacterium]|nr:hypothetical protein [Phycisphaerae bacterium]HNU44644.1 hypothetical protein [Phycisphaerae bacterium]
MGIPEYWWPYLYQYGVGGVVFVIGLALILGYRSCNLSRREDRFWLGVLVFGFAWYAGIHLLWYLAALYVLPATPTGGPPA